MSATISTLNAILKEFYLAPIQEQLNQEVLVLELMEKAVVDWAGKQVVIPLHTARNTGVDYRPDGGLTSALPTAGQETYVRAVVDAKFLYGRFEITGPAISSLAKGGTASFAGYVQAEMDKLVEDVRTKANRTAFCGGRVVGVLNQRKTEAAPAVWEFTGDVQKVNSLLVAAVAAKAVELTCDIHTSFAGDFGGAQGGYQTIATDIRLTVVDVPNSTLTLSALDTTKTATITIPQGFGAVVKITGAKDGGGLVVNVPAIDRLDSEPIGIYGNLGAQDHFGINRFFNAVGPVDNNPILRSTIITQNTAAKQDRAALSLARIQAVFDNVMEVAGVEPDYILMNPTQRQRYVALLQGQISGTGNLMFSEAGKGNKIADGGFVGLSYGNVPIKVSKDAPKGGLEFLKLDTWKLCELEKGDFADLDGSVISRVPGFDSYEGYYRFYYNTVSVRPNANAILVGCSL